MSDRKSPGFGGRLREARERRGLSLRQIATATKISAVALEALERDDIARLPGGIFSRAFVRAYAIEVGLEPETAIRDFLAQFPQDSVIAGHTSAPVEDSVAIEGDRKTASAFLWMGLVSIPIVGVLLYFSVVGWPMSDSDGAPVAATPAAATSTAGSGLGLTAPDPASLPQVSGPDLAPAPAPATALTAAEALDRTDETDAAVNSRLLTVGLAAVATCRVEVVVDGGSAFTGSLRAGERREFEVRQDVSVTVNDPAALSVTLNGAEARSLGRAGRTATMSVTVDNFKDYLTER